MKQAGLFGLTDHLKRLSAIGDPLEELGRVVDFEGFRPILEGALGYSSSAKGGRPPYDPVAMFKVLILAAQNNVADARMEYLIRDRLSWMRFLGFDLGIPTPDANTIRLFREKLTEAGTLQVLFDAFDHRRRTRYGRTSLPRRHKRTSMRAGRSSSPRASPKQTARSRAILQSRASAMTTTSPLTGNMDSSAASRSPTLRAMTGRCCARW